MLNERDKRESGYGGQDKVVADPGIAGRDNAGVERGKRGAGGEGREWATRKREEKQGSGDASAAGSKTFAGDRRRRRGSDTI